jgi:two-component system LytT family response regulator
MILRTLIVEPDEAAGDHLRNLLASDGAIEVAGECRDAESAPGRIRDEQPDLVFVEVPVPQGRLAALAASLESSPETAVIVVTSRGQNALAAFELDAVDYLLRPVEEARLKRALHRARAHLVLSRASTSCADPAAGPGWGEVPPAPQYLTRVTVKAADRILFLKTEQIDWVEAADNYIILHAGLTRHIVRQRLSVFAAALDPSRFVRVNRSALVNLDHIAELRPMFKGEYVLVLRDGKRLPLTRGLRELQKLMMFA